MQQFCKNRLSEELIKKPRNVLEARNLGLIWHQNQIKTQSAKKQKRLICSSSSDLTSSLAKVRSQTSRLWAPEARDKWGPVMCLLRCSACFGPHCFIHSCPVDPTSAWPTKYERLCHYFISFCGFPTWDKGPGIDSCIHVLRNPATEEAAPKRFIIWQATFEISQICWGLDANRGSISSSPLFRVSLTSETEIPVWEMEVSREKAEWLLQVCVKGQPRASGGLLLLEGQPECGIKALISSHSLCVLFQ